MSKVFIFEHWTELPGDIPELRNWKLKSVLGGPLNNGFLWNQVQPLLDRDLKDKGDCADYILIVEDRSVEDNSEQTTRAEEFKVRKAKVQLVNIDGRDVGR